ncbi:glycoside hydrolase [Rickenella mellea]|uniref:Alpha-amylase n=1 Tax=Rickenella mellea TaxID=50990 RepID=A0A4Y7Q5P8_9AGAM|nr:glycoside hydrolase [Rickenella mellea]
MKDVIIQMFEWTWDSIAAECTNFIGPAGGFVHVSSSPPQEHVQGTQWWTDYQPVSYILTSKRGNRTQFQNMINTCHTAGVKVIADTIFNHMSGADSGVGVAGSNFTHYIYPGTYQFQDFHHCGLEPNDDIVDFTNRLEVQTCQLLGLADLATDTEYVRSRLAEYANDLISLGVDGFRLDASKHIAATDLANITSRFRKTSYITQEVIWGAGEPIQPSEYAGIGDVQEFRYTAAVMNAFLGSGISNLQAPDSSWLPGNVANVFVANHDTERSGSSLNANSPSNTYTLAYVYSLAHPYGTPTVLSSYTGFTDSDVGAPNGGVGTCARSAGTNGWLCQHRWNAVAGMVSFRNQVGSTALVNWVSQSSQQIAFGRGTAGFVVINNADSTWTSTFTTSLPAGIYCDVIAGQQTSNTCTGSSFTVSSSGSISATIPARCAFAIHTGAVGTGSSATSGLSCASQTTGSTVSVVFNETATTVLGENIFVVGSIPQLGSWNPAGAIALSAASYPVWSTKITIPANTAFQYKYIRKESDGGIEWESDPNRNATTGSSGTQTLKDTWR